MLSFKRTMHGCKVSSDLFILQLRMEPLLWLTAILDTYGNVWTGVATSSDLLLAVESPALKLPSRDIIGRSDLTRHRLERRASDSWMLALSAQRFRFFGFYIDWPSTFESLCARRKRYPLPIYQSRSENALRVVRRARNSLRLRPLRLAISPLVRKAALPRTMTDISCRSTESPVGFRNVVYLPLLSLRKYSATASV